MLVYKLTVGFAIVKVISGVFLHETFSVAASDEELMTIKKTRAIQRHKACMQKVFSDADKNHDGSLTREEFKKFFKSQSQKTLFAAMELDASDADLLFDFLVDPLQLCQHGHSEDADYETIDLSNL